MIVHVLGRMTAGGNERLCLELIRRAPPGTKQALLTIDPTPRGPLESLFRDIPGLLLFHEPYAPTNRLAFVVRIARLFRRLRPTGVIAYPFGLHLLVALAAKVVPGCRVLSHVGNPPPAEGRMRDMFGRIVQASRLLGVPLWSCSQAVHDQLAGLGHTLPFGSRAVPNGIDISTLKASAASASAARELPGPVVGMTARLDLIKDHDTLIRAFARLVAERPTAKLWLGGDGSQRAPLEQLSAQLGIAHAVTFLGVRQNVGELLGQFDVFAFSTTSAEGFGIALAEAMAVGLPIVASDVPACREVLGQGACGLLVPPKDPLALAAGIARLLDDAAESRRLGEAAAARARSEYDIVACAHKYYAYMLNAAL